MPASKPEKQKKKSTAQPASSGGKTVESLTHKDSKRLNIPTAEYQPLLRDKELTPVQVAYARRNPDLDPQLVWRGKDLLDWSDLVVSAPPIYIQEVVKPIVLIDELKRLSESRSGATQTSLFSDVNVVPTGDAKTEFYQHDANWANRMILGDSLQVMASLAQREGLKGKVQCIYIDPPYGIKFNSNFQWSTTGHDVKEGPRGITREPEQVKAFRDTWRDGVNSYLLYLRDRLTVAFELLVECGSIFVQIGDENVHLVRALLDEVFDPSNFVALISFAKTTGLESETGLTGAFDYIIWYARSRKALKYRPQTKDRSEASRERFSSVQYIDGRSGIATAEILSRLDAAREWHRVFTDADLTKPGPGAKYEFPFRGLTFTSGDRWWGTPPAGLERMAKSNRLFITGRNRLRFVRAENDTSGQGITNNWSDVGGAVQSRSDPKVYVVQTGVSVVQRCLLMTTDPGDLVLDPTCGSGTTAYAAEQLGRRWITIDTSRVALALARARIMGARYLFYLLADSPEGQRKEAEIARRPIAQTPTYGSVRQGFVYGRVPHISPSSIANNTEVDVIYGKFQTELEPLREGLNAALKQKWQEWEIPREAGEKWSKEAKELHAAWWKHRIARQKEIDASIAAKADYEYLYDKPYDDNRKVRVAGPFTVESLSPHRTLAVDESNNLIDPREKAQRDGAPDFAQIILENLKTAGVQQAHREDRITFSSLVPWPGRFVCAEGRYLEGNDESGPERRAAILVGPEFGTVSRPDLVEAAREAADAKFDVLVACAFNFDAHCSDLMKLGRLPILKARMNADLHMAADLKKTDKANLFVIFGEPDIDLIGLKDGLWQVKLNGVDVFDPNSGEVRSDNADGIACWFIDTDYNEESFFVRHAYFLGANDPYTALRTTLKAEINEEAWSTLHSDVSRPFEKPKSGRIAVKVINHLGDEVMKVFRVG